MRILVYGAGVQGCQLAHSLAQNKKNVVTLLARGEWKEVIDQKGLTIRHMLQRKTTVDRMQTTDVLAPEDVYDLVFVTVQAGQLADVLPILKANRSQYFIFVGNDPYAQEMLQAMQRPVDKIAFGFQNNAGRREHDRLVSVHMGMGMTVGGATAPLSGAFRLRLQAAFEGTHYKLTYYSDMDEWLKSHIAFILPCAYACYAVDGELSRTTVEQRRMIVDAAWEGCEMLKAAGVPVNDAENTDRYREGTKQRKKTERMVYWMAQTVVGKWCISDHAMRAVSEMQYLDEAFAADWLEEMRGEAENEEFLSELSTQQMLAALGGDTINGVYTANFFVHADGIEIGYDLNYPADDPHDLGYIWVTAPFTFEEIASYASDSGFWNNIDVYAQ